MANSGGLRIKVEITGVRETLRAFGDLPDDAQRELRERSKALADALAVEIRAAGQADTRQSARAATSVRAVRDRVPVIEAGRTKRAQAVLFGSEFGMTRRSGWYAKARYGQSEARQYRPHLGAGSYWFFRTVEDNTARIDREWNAMADELIRRWGR